MQDGQFPQMRNFEVWSVPVQTSQQFMGDTNMVDFFNQGTTPVKVNGRILLPNTGFCMIGWPGEIDRTSYTIAFANNSDSGNALLITMKKYLD